MNLRFRVQGAQHDIREFEFDRDRVTIGRGPANDVVVDADAVGRRQGELRLDPDGELRWRCHPCGMPVVHLRSGATLDRSDGDEPSVWAVRPGDIVQVGEGDASISIEIVTAEARPALTPGFVAFRHVAPTSEEASVLVELSRSLARTSEPRPLLEGLSRLLAERRFDACDATFVLLSGPDEYHNDTYAFGADGACGPAPDPLMALGGALAAMQEAWQSARSVAALGNSVVLPFGEDAVEAALVLRVPQASPPLVDYLASVGPWLEAPIEALVRHRLLSREHAALAEENRYLRSRQRQHYLFKELVCESDAMRDVHRRLQRHLDDDLPLLIVGEAGTGKELLARVLHHCGARASEMIIRVSCAEFADERANFELFGSAPTEEVDGNGAPQKGVFELVRGGTVFLEEIDLLPPMVQAKLVRTLKEGEIRRVGEAVGRPVRARLIASVHRDLAESVASGRLRRDLYLLLKDQTIAVPALRERAEDIVPLARNFIAVFCTRYGLAPSELSEDAAQRLRTYAWPGNVRELQARIESAVLGTRGAPLTASALGFE